jgi:hypothetical protein
MRYLVNFAGINYDFVVYINSLYPNLKFNWAMNYPTRKKGDVEITKEAMDEATEQQNYFLGGSSDYLSNTTTVWVSKAIYNALKTKQPIEINADGNSEMLEYIRDYEYETVLNDEVIFLPTLYAESDRGNKLWILDNPDNPIILKMVLEWNIEIGSIETKEYIDKDK